MTPLLTAAKEVVESGLAEQALHFVRRNTPNRAVLEDGFRGPFPDRDSPDQLGATERKNPAKWGFTMMVRKGPIS
jgi:hypothetical protein